MSEKLKREWADHISTKLVGRGITSVRYMTDKERKEQLWSKSAVVIQLDDGCIR